MANATVSRLGQVNAAGDAVALFLKVFAGEVLTAFEQATIMQGLHTVRTIANGKSASFPATGRITSGYHTPGAELVGTAVNANEKVITIDGLLVAQAFIANIDEAMNHYDVRSIYSAEMGRQLASVYDKNVLQEGILGARENALVTGLPNGYTIQDDGFDSGTLATKAAAFAKAMFTAAQKFDENDVPKEGRVCILRPADYYALVQDTTSINVDWGGQGSYAQGSVVNIAGIRILSSNNVPGTDLSGNTYHGGHFESIFAAPGSQGQTKGLVFHPSGIGTVKLLDLAMESAYDIRRQGTLMVAKYAVGHGWLRPECLIELEGDAPAA
jgi:hypothetical protein